MKFTHQIKFNSVPEWRDHYIDYAHLKKIIYAIAKAEADEQQQHHLDEEHPLLTRQQTAHGEKVEATEEALIQALDKELAKIIKFIMAKEAETLGKLAQLDLEVHSLEAQRVGSMFTPPIVNRFTSLQDAGNTRLGGSLPDPQKDGFETLGLADRRPSEVMEEAVRPDLEGGIGSNSFRASRVHFWHSNSLPATTRTGARVLAKDSAKMKPRITDLFVVLHDLKNYLSLNKEGFRKILKKHDKMTSSNLKSRYWCIIEEQYPSKKEEGIMQAINKLVDLYAVLFLKGDFEKASSVLNRVLGEQIKVERNTVWRDMVAMERKTVNAAVHKPQGVATRVTWLQQNMKHILLMLAVLTFATLLTVQTFEEPEKNNCLAMLVFVSMLWATEAIPLFATSMLVPPLVVILRVMVDHTKSPPERMPAKDAAPAIFHSMFSQAIMLLLGGFAIAAALSKHYIAKQLAISVMSRVGRKPQFVILAAMCVAAFVSMFISNVAAPVLTYSIVMPILKTLDTGCPFGKALVMGIALASNVGGMTSPISSPQNIFAIQLMSNDSNPPSWLAWFAISLPVSALCVLMCWSLILIVYQPWRRVAEVRPLKPSTDPINGTQVYVIIISLATVALWCANTVLTPYTGEMGVVAVLPLVAFFGFGVLSKEDFNGFLWNVIMLAMGGMAVGEAVKSSGLLHSIALGIQDLTSGLDLFQVMIIFCLLVLICTTFISHTVGAMVILPIVQSVGESMPGTAHPKLLVMATVLMCSGAMGLPISGFPNMQAVSLDDGMGQNYVSTIDFLMVGVPSSVLAYFVIVSVGYSLMLLVRF
ncbi:hypothetical protein CEUSTIGMA_g1009.t1 [Chlamydomonas eustigma]|uniref:SPX domain-containing protein n=1 Tax=Chlamydomonas eustigma TaxID=1157962 RepID=A0A250WRU6_9CHLO|nr:hypothetical protein CEUSTIGMA_g1009.t1 [Chlamydomonas eustigma]|eukprot:GAX73558.1 hypothetical protein CEUSTIGMA_g1009.t1 [Chlamydomonas eustigma]